MADLIQILVLGLALGGVYALMGAGLSLVFGVMRIVNLAHPSLIMLGAYVAYWAFRLGGIDPMIILPVALVILAATGVLLYKLVFEREARSAQYSEMTVLLTFALAMVVEGALGTAFTNTQRVTSPRLRDGCVLHQQRLHPQRPALCRHRFAFDHLGAGAVSEILRFRERDPRHHSKP